MIPFDDSDLLSRVVDIETDAGTFRGIQLGSVWTVRGVTREDTLAANEWLVEKARAAGWVVDVYDQAETGDSVRRWYAAREPRVAIHLTHSGEGDDHVVGECSAWDAAAIVRALNGEGGSMPPAGIAIRDAADRVNARWFARGDAEGTPWYTAERVICPEDEYFLGSGHGRLDFRAAEESA